MLRNLSITKLSHLKIRTRIFGGFGLIVALGLGSAVYGVWALSGVSSDVGTLGQKSEKSIKVLTATRTLESMRRIATRFATIGDPELAKEFNSDADQVDTIVKDLAKRSVQADRARNFEAVADTLAAHRATFDQLVKSAAAVTENTAKLVSGGDDMTAATGKLVDAVRAHGDAALSAKADDVNASVLLVRVANWRFLATSDPKGPATFQTNFAKANASLDNLEAAVGGDLRPQVDAVRSTLGAYKASFDIVATAILARSDIFLKGINPQQTTMLKDLQNASDLITVDFNNARDSAVGLVASTSHTQEIVALLSLLIGVTFAFFVGRSIAVPVGGMSAAMKKLATGNTDVEIPGADGQDEIADMARAVAVFRDNAIEKRKLEAERAKKQLADQRRQEEIDQLVGIFGKSMSCLFKTTSEASAQMSATSSALEQTAIATTGQADEVMAEAEHSNNGAQTVAAASQELTSSIEEISRQVTHSSQIAGAAMQQVSDASVICNELRAAAESIGNVVKLIDGIAGQTNLLALNATIEAARAGEAGKGFAVVASEVKALANQTSLATNDITEQVAAIQAATKGAVAALDAIGGTIHEISEITVGITAAVEEQGAATQEIARSIAQVSSDTASVTSRMSTVRQATDASSTQALEVKEKAQELSQEATVLSGEVKDFIEALGELGDAKSFRTYTVDIAAVVKLGGGTVARRVVSLSAGAVRFNGPIDAPLGTRVSFTMAGVADELSGRVVQSDSTGALIQLPLNHTHLAAMEDVIGRVAVVDRAA